MTDTANGAVATGDRRAAPGTKPLAIDLFCGLGGWTDGLLAEGYDVIGFDIERHEYGEHRYPGLLVVQDVTTLHGSQFKDATLIVASPPCQAYSYRAMPWKRAKALPPPDNTLFEACFRLQREACEAASRHIPLIVENVRGAQKWVGRSRWAYGSFYLWGDVPALMPITFKGVKGKPYETGNKNDGGSWFAIAHNTTSGKGQNPDGRKGVGPAWDPATRSGARGMARWTNPAEGRKGAGAGAAWFDGNLCQLPSASPRRKMASAMIAKIPLPLARHIGRVALCSVTAQSTSTRSPTIDPINSFHAPSSQDRSTGDVVHPQSLDPSLEGSSQMVDQTLRPGVRLGRSGLDSQEPV